MNENQTPGNDPGASTQTMPQSGASFKEKAQEWQQKTIQSVREAALTTDDYVRENPWTVIGWVAGVSFLVGFLLGRSRD